MAAEDWPLCVLEIEDPNALIEAYRDIYMNEYARCDIRDWAGRRVMFRPMTFNHAFSESTDYRLSAGIHDVELSLSRAQRIRWIKLALQAQDVQVEVLGQQRQDSRGRWRRRRTLLVLDNRYVVVMEPCSVDGFEFQFVTAFVANKSYMDQIRRGATVLERRRPEKKMPQS